MALHDPHGLIGVVLVGRYGIREHLATEILGEVYAARDQRSGRSARVKVLRTDLVEDPRRFERFGREVTASWLAAHPNTLEVLDWGQERGLLFLVTEDFDGQDLWTWRRTHPCEAEEAAEIAAQVAAALVAAHTEGVLHRALTPTNVLVGRDETGDWRVKVRDFGMADLESEDPEREDTTTLNARLEEVRFVAPEYFTGGGPSRATDLYSLGALLFFLVVGEPPEHSGDGRARGPADQVTTAPWFDAVARELLSVDPAGRPGANAVLQRLERGVGRRLVPAAAVPGVEEPTEVRDGGPDASLAVGLVAGLGCAAVSLLGSSTIAMAAMLAVWVRV